MNKFDRKYSDIILFSQKHLKKVQRTVKYDNSLEFRKNYI
jgi:hypothetical protein